MKHLTQPLTIRDITIPNRIVMSPMTGYTDMPFRKICAELGAKVLFSEMVHAGLLLYGNKKTRKIYLENSVGAEHPSASSGQVVLPHMFAVQIFGSNPEWIKKAVYMLSQEDGFSWIDINMGCPVRKVIKEGAGAALMLDLDKAKEIIKAARSTHNGILSVKMRTGWSRNNKNAPQLCKIAADEGVDLITIHGRTREEFYTGPIDFETIAKIKKMLKVPIFGNGGLMTPENVKTMVEKTGVDGVMIARGAFGNPWIFKQIEDLAKIGTAAKVPPGSGLTHPKGLTPGFGGTLAAVPIFEKKEVYLRYANYLFDYYGERKALPLAQKAAIFYFKGIEGAAHFRGEVYKTNNFDKLKNLVNQL